jgi:hypothetical protein
MPQKYPMPGAVIAVQTFRDFVKFIGEFSHKSCARYFKITKIYFDSLLIVIFMYKRISQACRAEASGLL